MKYSTLFLLLFLVVLSSCGDIMNESYTIKKGAFKASLVESGELNTVKSKPVVMPYIGWRFGWRYTVIGLAEHGSKVKLGDSIAKIDPGNVDKYIIENTAELEIEKGNLSKMLVIQQNSINSLKTEFEEAKANYNLTKLSVEKFGFESKKKQLTKKLEFEQAEIKLETVKRKLELREKINTKERTIQELKIIRKEQSIAGAYDAKKKLTIHSPGNGIMQLAKNRRTRQMCKIGDEIYQGQRFASIPDLSRMKVETTVSETDIYKVKTGQKVEIRLDAYPAKAFMGTISYISKLSHEKEESASIKVFDLEILVDEQDPILKPGMTVSCEIFTVNFDDMYFVENECLIKENGQYFVYCEEGGSNTKYPVKTGPRNNKCTVIYGDLRQGQKVVPINELKKKNAK